MRPQLVIVDLIGPLVEDDGVLARALAETTIAFGRDVTPQQAARSLLRADPAPLLRRWLGATLSAPALERYNERAAHLIECEPCVRPARGADRAMDRLHRASIPLAIDAGLGRAALNAALLRFGWCAHPVVQATVAFGETLDPRPDADTLVRAMLLCGLGDPAAVARVATSLPPIRQAVAAGCGWVVRTGQMRSRRSVAYQRTEDLEAAVDLLLAGDAP